MEGIILLPCWPIAGQEEGGARHHDGQLLHEPDLVQRMVGEGCVQGSGPVDALQAGEYPWDPEPVLGDQGLEEYGCYHL
jgi:hypothetical protein